MNRFSVVQHRTECFDLNLNITAGLRLNYICFKDALHLFEAGRGKKSLLNVLVAVVTAGVIDCLLFPGAPADAAGGEVEDDRHDRERSEERRLSGSL